MPIRPGRIAINNLSMSVHPEQAAMRIVLSVIKGPHKSREFSFEEHDNFIVGRAKVAHFRLPLKDKFFSRVHFMVEINPPLCRLLDMQSTNGTLVNGQQVTTADLKDGDMIKAGKTVIRVSLQDVGDPAHEAPAISQGSRLSSDFEHVAIVGPTPTPSITPSASNAPPTRVGETVPPPTRIGETVPPRAAFATDAMSCRVCGSPLPELPSLRDGNFLTQLPICGACRLLIREHPQPIAGCRLVRELGRGGMGVVYLAIRLADGALVALKTIKPAIVGTKIQTERFLREAQILRQLVHPQIVAFRDMGESNGLFYFAMDYVRGSDVAMLQKEYGGPLPIHRAVDLTCQMLSALEFAHGMGFVHRDIKPANMLIEEKDGRDVMRLTDFGLARTYQSSPMSGLTLRGEIGGTMAFVAPEQISNFRDAKPPVDQYAAGATLYKMLTDRFVFDLPRRIEQQLLMILQSEPVAIRERLPEIPEALAAVVHRSLAKDPKTRFADVGAMRRALVRLGGKRGSLG